MVRSSSDRAAGPCGRPGRIGSQPSAEDPDGGETRRSHSRRRSKAWVATLVVLIACSGGSSYGEILDRGTGPANTRPLWPLASGILVSHVDSSSVEPVGPPRQAVISQRRTSEGRLVTVDAGTLPLRGAAMLRDTLDLLETRSGDVVAIEPDGGRYLMVPSSVRVGMRWRAEIPTLRGAWFLEYDGGSKRYGSEWTFEVTSRDEVEGRFGPQIVWTLVGTGPKVPHVVKDGRACYDSDLGRLDALFCTTTSPLENVPRQSVTWRFVEGQGPIQVYAGLGGHEALLTGGAALPELLPVLVGEPELAGGDPSRMSTLALDALSVSEELETALANELGVFMGTSARFTASSTELSAGHAAELVLFGSGYLATNITDPNGQRIDDWVVDRAALCLAVDPEGPALVALDRLADACPDRVGPNPLSRGELESGAATPYVTPDGRWWARADVERLGARGGDRINGTFDRSGIHAHAPFVRDGVLHTLNCHGDGPSAPCELIAFPNEPRLTQSNTGSTFATGVYVWGSVPVGQVLRSGGCASGNCERPPTDVVRFTVPHEHGLIHVTASRPQTIVRWFSFDGRMLDYRTVPVWQPTVWHVDGEYQLHDVRPLGELYRIDVSPEGLVVRAVGRLDLPGGERAEAAVPLDDRFLVVTSRRVGDGSTGLPLPSAYDSDITEYGAQPAIPSSLRKTLRFYLSERVDAEAPEDPIAGVHAWPVWQTGSLVSFCDAHDGTPRVTSIVVGGEAIPLSSERDGSGCHHVRLPPSVIDVSREVGVLPVVLTVDELGSFHRHLPWTEHTPDAPNPDEPDPDEPDPDEGPDEPTTLATLPTTSDRFPSSVRPPASDAVCTIRYDFDYQPPGPMLTTCRFEPWHAETPPEGTRLAVCDPTSEGPTSACLDLLAFDGDPTIFDTHDFWVASPDHEWARGRPELFSEGRVFWIPRERPAGPLVAADFEHAVSLDAIGRHWRVVPDPEAWRLPRDLRTDPDEPEPVGTWPERLGLPIVEPTSFDPTSLLEGSGLDGLPTPTQRWERHGTTVEVYGPPLSRWLRSELVATARDVATRWTSGALPSGASSAVATDGELVLWDVGTLVRLEGSPVAQSEVCNGIDDDGDGTTDESGPGLCPDPDAVMACEEGICFRSACATGRVACGANPARCDVQLGTSADCLGCGDACPAYGGSECSATGCTPTRLTEVVATSRGCWRRFETGEWLGDDGVVETGWAAIAGTSQQECRVDLAGMLACECTPAGVWEPCGHPTAPLDRIWVGEGSRGASFCGRVAAGGDVFCGGPVVAELGLPSDAYGRVAVAELRGAHDVVFGGPIADHGYALVGTDVYVFGRVFVGTTPTWRLERVAGLPPVTAIHAARGYALFESSEGVFALGSLGTYPALGGPSGLWSTPTRAPGLDGALQLLATDGGPCKRTEGSILCAYRPGAYGDPPPGWTKTLDPAWIELAGDFRAVAARGVRICLVGNDVESTSASEIVRTY